MAQSVWLRSPESGGILKKDYFDGITCQCADTLLAECLYFDTADMDLYKNETALMLCAAENGIRQVVLFGKPDEGMAEGIC
jgi:hypothetical protein